MKRKGLFNYCGFSYAVTIEGELVKSVELAGVGVNAETDNVEIAGLKPDLTPFTGFERCVMEKALEIPRGMVATYGELARAAGRARAARAVGNAMARNPMPIMVPCHRVVRSDLTMGEYAHGSETKEALLRSEGVVFEGGKVRRECLHRF
ncbi:MAG: methylated-DNA--[protein]-cysteine S-methyltransferase [Candidatus Hydrothermarchaeaceae archaeon]